MKSHKSKFLEKKIKITPEGTKSISTGSQEKIIIVTIVIALVILSGLLVYLVFQQPEKEFFSAIYYLDSEGTLENFPNTVILGQNNTFTLIVGVINQNGTTMDYLVKVNIDDGKSVYNLANATVTGLEDDDFWEDEVTIFLDRPGSNKIIFELYARDHERNLEYAQKYESDLEHQDTGNQVFFSIEAINP
jgi:uncharacterized membrane protein